MKTTLTLFLWLSGSLAFAPPVMWAQTTDLSDSPPITQLITCGQFIKIFDQSINESHKWYINDHCFIQDTQGKWHLFGITHEEPADPLHEIHFAHATADSLLQHPWAKEPFALTVDRKAPWDEFHLWAPDVIFHHGQYYMYYCAGGATHTTYKIHVALSTDLTHWTRHQDNPMVIDGYDARDPFILPLQDKWLLYYTATRPDSLGHHVVIAVESHDLLHWTNQRVVFTHPDIGTWGGPTESPFVVYRHHKYYLFVCTNTPYDNTAVYESDSPIHWEYQNKVAELPAHCAEVIHVNKAWYISRAGWGRGGVYLAKLQWNDEDSNPQN